MSSAIALSLIFCDLNAQYNKVFKILDIIYLANIWKTGKCLSQWLYALSKYLLRGKNPFNVMGVNNFFKNIFKMVVMLTKQSKATWWQSKPLKVCYGNIGQTNLGPHPPYLGNFRSSFFGRQKKTFFAYNGKTYQWPQWCLNDNCDSGSGYRHDICQISYTSLLSNI